MRRRSICRIALPRCARRRARSRRRCRPRTARCSRCPMRARSSGISRTRPGSSRRSSSSASLRGYRPFDPAFRVLFNSYYNAIGERASARRARPPVAAVARRGHRVSRARRRLHGPAVRDRQRRRGARADHGARAAARAAASGAHPDRRQASPVAQSAGARLSPPAAASAACRAAAPVDRARRRTDRGRRRRCRGSRSTTNRRAIACTSRRSSSRRHPVTNREYLAFIDDGGYRRPELWLALGWDLVQAQKWEAPLYWDASDGWLHGVLARRPRRGRAGHAARAT